MNYNDYAYSGNLSLYALSNTNDKLAKVKIAVLGKWDGHTAGSFEVDTKVMEEMLSNFNKQIVDVVCDYEHQTLTGETAPASGWIKSLKIENSELYAFVEWTDKAKEMIQNKEYKYVSPVFQPNTIEQVSNSVIGWTLHSLSLTNTPFLEELGEVVANSNKLTISLKKDNDKLSSENISLKNELKILNNEKIEQTVNKAITDNKLKPEQREYALKLAKQDLAGFESFITNNRMINIPQNDLFINSKGRKSQKSDIQIMRESASKQTV